MWAHNLLSYLLPQGHVINDPSVSNALWKCHMTYHNLSDKYVYIATRHRLHLARWLLACSVDGQHTTGRWVGTHNYTPIDYGVIKF